MKTRTLHFPLLILSSLFILLSSSCEKDEDETPNFVELISNRAEFSTLNSAVNKGGLVSKLSGTNQLTFFAPDNDAFSTVGFTGTVLDNLTSTEIANILNYHIISGKILSPDIQLASNTKLLTSSGDSVFVTKNTNGVFVNGIKVSEADILVSNGVIHKFSIGVLKPASGNILVTAAREGLDSMVKALNFAATGPGGDPTIATSITTDILTIFAPTNAAFTSLLTELNLTDITQIPMPTLIATLKFHAVEGRVFSSDLLPGSLLMASGANTTIALANGGSAGFSIAGIGNGSNTANITKMNIVATNGVIYFIDKILIP